METLICWNVNGIRASIRKGFREYVLETQPDVLCVQETKAPGADVEIDLPGYEQYWNHADKKGYSGTAIFTKIKPIGVVNDLGVDKHDHEGRVMTAEFKDYYLVNVYVPNSKRGLERLPYREKEWDVDFLKHLKKLQKKKPVVFCGDMNVAHQEIDLTYPKPNIKNHGFTPEERKGFDNIIAAGFVDTFRIKNKEGEHYTWWSPMRDCRAKNIGWRIDYFGVSEALTSRVKTADILKDVMGSDHCPIRLVLK